MGLEQRTKIHVRYTPEQFDRLGRVLRHLGLTAQSYQHQAVMRRVESDEAEMGERKAKRDARRDGAQRPTGSGVGLFRSRFPEPVAEIQTPPAPTPVVVNVGADRTTDGLIERLAKRVLESPSHEHDRRLREAKSAIQTMATDDDERRSLTEKLEAEIARKSERKGGLLGDGLERLFKGWSWQG